MGIVSTAALLSAPVQAIVTFMRNVTTPEQICWTDDGEVVATDLEWTYRTADGGTAVLFISDKEDFRQLRIDGPNGMPLRTAHLSMNGDLPETHDWTYHSVAYLYRADLP